MPRKDVVKFDCFYQYWQFHDRLQAREHHNRAKGWHRRWTKDDNNTNIHDKRKRHRQNDREFKETAQTRKFKICKNVDENKNLWIKMLKIIFKFRIKYLLKIQTRYRFITKLSAEVQKLGFYVHYSC